MLGSNSCFFNQSKRTLQAHWFDVCELLNIKGYSVDQVGVYMDAFEHFLNHPYDYDGATIVKDLCDIPDLDLDAMLHDFHYLKYNVASSVVMKWKADWLYAKGQERKGKGLYSAYSRFIGLAIVGIGFIPYARISRGKMTKKQKELFLKDYEVLINK